MPRLSDLGEREILALAIANEEEDGRIYADFAQMLAENYPDSAAVFRAMAAEEESHRRNLIDLFSRRFGAHIPLVRRQDIRGFPMRLPAWRMKTLRLDAIRDQTEEMERDAARFYRVAASRSTDAETRRLLGDLAVVEDGHLHHAQILRADLLGGGRGEREDESARRRFVLQVVQPGLVGLMDGSVSTLAPVFAAAYATHDSWNAFLVGLAASVGAGISMGFAEALADDGKLSGRGRPLLRGLICGLMTMGGGIGHTLPFLIPAFHLAVLAATAVVVFELLAISWIRWRYQDTPFVSAILQIMLGGGLVFAAGVLIGQG
ncbi:iron exporter MbfA [Acidomonas methanolica]|uniref:Rubrerythrin n=1 Tax=Acidomonas methanolica NBRC 104435 TaxID=1231351 RepID=A0A023D3Z4_ACIMT|nr:ferritin family protein [Acidomonas methanolica]MBU2653613.1 rubrerythrin [Acidomonas methanolica]TCS31564.1 rubrerythrin [Acidomonas methanolica]GAJ28779.1 rubrerythrin [Acidomonas methanolica NBRC 104435]GBQ58197.1 hypothetical protein AA0498_2599 [Acidomonas methanolica]GEK97983.1 membrane protein [Acidomonas methanolica NBRC 104435]